MRINGHIACVFSLLAVLMAGGVAMAFDSAEWLLKRDVLTEEAKRLQGAYAKYAALATSPAEDLSIPVDTFEDGAVKTIIIAKKAQYFHADGIVWAEDVLLKKLDQDGTLKAKIEARHCIVDRKTKSGWADGAARVTQGSTTFSGNGIYFSSPEGYVMVTEGAEIVSKDLRFGGALQ